MKKILLSTIFLCLLSLISYSQVINTGVNAIYLLNTDSCITNHTFNIGDEIRVYNNGTLCSGTQGASATQFVSTVWGYDQILAPFYPIPFWVFIWVIFTVVGSPALFSINSRVN